jgi:hypothetical protein
LRAREREKIEELELALGLMVEVGEGGRSNDDCQFGSYPFVGVVTGGRDFSRFELVNIADMRFFVECVFRISRGGARPRSVAMLSLECTDHKVDASYELSEAPSLARTWLMVIREEDAVADGSDGRPVRSRLAAEDLEVREDNEAFGNILPPF